MPGGGSPAFRQRLRQGAPQRSALQEQQLTQLTEEKRVLLEYAVMMQKKVRRRLAWRHRQAENTLHSCLPGAAWAAHKQGAAQELEGRVRMREFVETAAGRLGDLNVQLDLQTPSPTRLLPRRRSAAASPMRSLASSAGFHTPV